MKVPVLGFTIVLASFFSYEAAAQNIALDSREYKVGLAVERLPKEPAAVDTAIRKRLDSVRRIEPGRSKQAQVQFLDTDSCALTKNALLLRARSISGKEPRLTLKIRNSDILAVDTMPIALASQKSVSIEDDFNIGEDGKPASDFSKSLSFDGPIPNRLANIKSHIVNLEHIGPGVLQQDLYSGPQIAETVFVSKPVAITDPLEAEVELSLWYDQAGGALLAADLSFTVEAPFEYPQLQAAEKLLLDFADALGDFKGHSAEKAKAAVPAACR
ncbi:hypothetical protein CAP48_12295 [Advenella sp. S44]|uniref:hypothetical protein n=1 Tax=Advenella sp. S44 TaxID=1982755 RepID=UPI000C2B02BC|nr:hypothetical protein [Advenella sp. S44]PJX23849.1 hypothetical protein CAP48_12295 [Advenella sp. S44]